MSPTESASYDPKPTVDQLVQREGLDGAAWSLLGDAYRALQGHVPSDAGLLLEMRELLTRRPPAVAPARPRAIDCTQCEAMAIRCAEAIHVARDLVTWAGASGVAAGAVLEATTRIERITARQAAARGITK